MTRVRFGRLSAAVLAIVSAAACGGGGTGPGATSAKHGRKAGDHESGGNGEGGPIGDSAVAQGGLASLGGAGNREGNGPVASLAGALRADRVEKGSPVRLDGMLGEWPARTGAKQAISGTAVGTTFSAALQYDDTKIYVGGEITEASFVRTSRFGEGEDHASLVLIFPGSQSAYEIGFFAGVSGESQGQVRFSSGPRKGQEVPGSKIVEAPAAKGYSFEAQLPWSTFSEAHALRVGLRGALRYYDAEGGAMKAVVATGAGDAANPSALPWLPTEPEQSLIEGLLAPKGLIGQPASVEVFADVGGDAMKERIAVHDKTITICGPGYRGGKEYFFKELGAELVRLESASITGRGKDDLVLRRRFPQTGGSRERFEVWSLIGGDEPVTTFAHEIAIVSGGKHLNNSVHVSGREIEVGVEPAVGWDIGSYKEPIATDVEPILFPWGGVKSRVFRFDGARFAKAKEVTQTPARGFVPSTPAAGVAPGAPDRPIEPKAPTVRRNTDLSQALFDQYKKDKNVAADARPKFDLQVQIEGDARPERVVLMGRDIVVFGPGFKGGSQYAFLTLQQFADDADIQDMSARDLTGDGAADLVVRGVRRMPVPGSPASLEIDQMFVYAMVSGALTRIFSIETGREQAGKRIQGLVQFVPGPGGRGFEIDVRPGLAKGWTNKTYPWAQEQPGAAIEPLLLPWGGIPSLRYAWNGTAFASTTSSTGR